MNALGPGRNCGQSVAQLGEGGCDHQSWVGYTERVTQSLAGSPALAIWGYIVSWQRYDAAPVLFRCFVTDWLNTVTIGSELSLDIYRQK